MSASAARPDPYRVLFPLGAFAALAGAAPWIASAFGLGGYPLVLHRTLMMQGFELCFVMGFLFTAMPAFTHGERCRPWELIAGTALAAASIAAALPGLFAIAHAAFTLALIHVVAMLGRRVFAASAKPPEEFLFVGLGIGFGIAGGALQSLAALGIDSGVPEALAARMVSLGMMLPIVLGVGSLLVPAFAGIRDPLLIPGIAKPHERRGRRALYATLAAIFASSFLLDGRGAPEAAAWTRALVASAMLLWVWKVWRTPRVPSLYGWALWSTGVLAGSGILLAALAPQQSAAALHLTFLGGFGLLTLGIATRVTVSHGKHPMGDESRLFGFPVIALVIAATLVRVSAGWLPPAAQPHAYATGAALWMLAWAWWLSAALPRLLRSAEQR